MPHAILHRMGNTNPNWPEIESQVFMATGRRMPVVLVRGEGTRV